MPPTANRSTSTSRRALAYPTHEYDPHDPWFTALARGIFERVLSSPFQVRQLDAATISPTDEGHVQGNGFMIHPGLLAAIVLALHPRRDTGSYSLHPAELM
jgi:hypothetical protein